MTIHKKFITTFLFIGFLVRLANGQSGSDKIQTRIFNKIDLSEEQNFSFFRPGDEIGLQLVNAVIDGHIQMYQMKSLGNIIKIEPIFYKGKYVIQHYPENKDELLEWESNEVFYYGDIVYYNGLTYFMLQDDGSGTAPDVSTDWEIFEESLLIPEQLSDLVIDFTVSSDGIAQINFLHFWYYDDTYSESYYLLSLKFDECMAYFESSGIPWFRESKSEWGWITGEIFLTESLQNKNNRMAIDLLSVGPEKIPGYRKISNEYNDPDLRFSLKDEAIYNSGFNGVTKIATFSRQEFLKSSPLTNSKFSGFISYTEALLNLLDTPPISLDTISIGGKFTNTNEELIYEFEEDLPESDRYSNLDAIHVVKRGSMKANLFSLLMVMEYDLNYVENMGLNEPEEEVAGLLIEGVKSGKIKNIYIDYTMTSGISKSLFIDGIAVRDLEMEEEYNKVRYWDETETYTENEKVRISDTVFVSLDAFNKGNDPIKSGGFWKRDKILSNTETYLYDEFDKLQVVYNIQFDSVGIVNQIVPVAIQPVVSISNSIEDMAIMPGFLLYSECKKLLAAKNVTLESGETLSMEKVIADMKLKGYPVTSGYIRVEK